MHSGNIFFKYFKLFLREGLRILEIISGEKGEGGRGTPGKIFYFYPRALPA